MFNMVAIKRYLVAIVLALFSVYVNAQISYGGLPFSLNKNSLRSSETIPTIDISVDYTQERESNQFAYQTVTDISITKEALSSVVDDVIIYRLMIHSDSAKSINLIFSPISLPNGARMFLSRPDGMEIYGAYTKESLSGDVFATTPVSGDNILIQCEVPVESADQFYASVSAVNSGFSNLRLLPELGKAQECEVDVVCDEYGLGKQRRSTCLMIVNGMRYCTGTLIATNDNGDGSYVLTSGHCLWNNSGDIDTLYAKRSVFFFGYESQICEARIIGTYEKSISSSRIVRADIEKDMALLKLSKRPPVDYMAYESGWNISESPRGPVACIHHPSGDLKKINISEEDPMQSTFEEDYFIPNSHWKINQWVTGITESGSSGAPLFDRDGLIIGALSGGESYCYSPGNDDFWRLNSVWNGNTNEMKNLGSLLDAAGSGITRMEGKETYENPCALLKNYGKDEELNEPYLDGYYATGHNSLGMEEFAEIFDSPYEKTSIYGVSFIPIAGTYDENLPVYMRIYTGVDMPDTLVYESVVKITRSEFSSIMSGFITTQTKNWSYKENYIRLDSAVTVGKRFYVSFATNYEQSDFAMLANYSDNKTAMFKRNGLWESWEKHPFDQTVGSMFVNAVVKCDDSNKNDVLPSAKDIHVYPNPVKETVYFECEDEIKSIIIFNAVGAVVESTTMSVDGVNVKSLPKGLYSVEITTDNGKYHTKFIKE